MDKVSIIIRISDPEFSREQLAQTLYSLRNQTQKVEKIFILGIDGSDLSVVNDLKNGGTEIEYFEECHWLWDFLFSDRVKQISSGYVCFLNINDMVSVDWNRLMSNALSDNSDSVIFPESMRINPRGVKYYFNLEPSLYDITFNSEDSALVILDRFAPMSETFNIISGKFFSVEALRNALDNEEVFEGEKLPDEVLESVLLRKICENSTGIRKAVDAFYFKSEKKTEFLYNNNDITLVKHFADRLKEISTGNDRKTGIYGTMLRHMKLMERIPKFTADNDLKKLFDEFRSEYENLETDYFNSIVTNIEPVWNDFEDMKSAVASPETEVVSFDVFDTLIRRTVLDPIDVFVYLDRYFNEKVGSKNPVQFHNIRRECENISRDRILEEHPQYEDQTLEEIYAEIERSTNFSHDVIEYMMEKELEIEKRVCKRREVGYELYNLAKDCGKKIIITSDMYLPEDVVKEILLQNGYDDISEIYISSTYRLGKYTSSLYKCVLKELGCKAGKVVHIGDNWMSDVQSAKSVGIRAFHLAKGIDLFKGDNPGIYKGNSYRKIFQPNGTMIDGRCAFDLFSGIRLMAALTVEKFFNNPYIGFNRETDFNANPYLIGYYCVGMHLLAIVDWLYEDVKEKGYSRIHFLGRDGYLPLEAYKIWTEGCLDVPDACYTYMSRYIIPLCDLRSDVDIYDFIDKMNLLSSTPKKVINLFRKCIPEDKFARAREFTEEAGYLYEEPLKKYSAVYTFLKFVAQEFIDDEMLRIEQEKTSRYFKSVFRENECLFDMGYNGRVETALASSLGFKVDSYYIHSYKELTYNRAKSNDFKIHAFYDFQPVTTFLCREQIFSKLDSSIKEVRENEKTGEWELIFGDYNISPAAEWVTRMIQRGAIQFIKDFKEMRDEFRNDLNWRRMDASLPFEFYMHKSTYLDRLIFSPVKFEDEFGENVVFNLTDYWQNNLDMFKMLNAAGNSNIEESVELQNVRDELNNAHYQLNEIRNSFSYKLAMMFTALPRKLRAKKKEE